MHTRGLARAAARQGGRYRRSRRVMGADMCLTSAPCVPERQWVERCARAHRWLRGTSSAPHLSTRWTSAHTRWIQRQAPRRRVRPLQWHLVTSARRATEGTKQRDPKQRTLGGSQNAAAAVCTAHDHCRLPIRARASVAETTGGSAKRPKRVQQAVRSVVSSCSRAYRKDRRGACATRAHARILPRRSPRPRYVGPPRPAPVPKPTAAPAVRAGDGRPYPCPLARTLARRTVRRAGPGAGLRSCPGARAGSVRGKESARVRRAAAVAQTRACTANARAADGDRCTASTHAWQGLTYKENTNEHASKKKRSENARARDTAGARRAMTAVNLAAQPTARRKTAGELRCRELDIRRRGAEPVCVLAMDGDGERRCAADGGERSGRARRAAAAARSRTTAQSAGIRGRGRFLSSGKLKGGSGCGGILYAGADERGRWKEDASPPAPHDVVRPGPSPGPSYSRAASSSSFCLF
jgi:hypothetical protein